MEGIVDLQAFYQGTSFDAHGMLGAHLLPGGGVAFRVFAPGAHGVVADNFYVRAESLKIMRKIVSKRVVVVQ